MRFIATGLLFAVALLAMGCHTGASEPIFPRHDPARVWPPSPDQPRIQYVGELRGEASLKRRPQGWAALRAVLTGSEPQVEFSHPAAVAAYGDVIFVADTGLGVVHRLDLEQREHRVLRGSADDQLQVPIDVEVAGEQVLVVDRGRSAVDVFDLAGDWQSTHRWDEVAAPVALAADPSGQQVLVVDSAAHACYRWNTAGDVVQLWAGGRGTAAGEFNFPRDVTWCSGGVVYIVDGMNGRVQVLGDNGQPIGTIGQRGTAAGSFAGPRSVACDSAGHVYVVDNRFENVQIFDVQGRLLLAFGEEGAAPGQFSLPAGITIDGRDRIWVADSYNQRVQVFQYLAEETP